MRTVINAINVPRLPALRRRRLRSVGLSHVTRSPTRLVIALNGGTDTALQRFDPRLIHLLAVRLQHVTPTTRAQNADSR